MASHGNSRVDFVETEANAFFAIWGFACVKPRNWKGMPALIVMGVDSRPRKPCPGFVRPQPGLARLRPAPASSAAAFSRLDPGGAARPRNLR